MITNISFFFSLQSHLRLYFLVIFSTFSQIPSVDISLSLLLSFSFFLFSPSRSFHLLTPQPYIQFPADYHQSKSKQAITTKKRLSFTPSDAPINHPANQHIRHCSSFSPISLTSNDEVIRCQSITVYFSLRDI